MRSFYTILLCGGVFMSYYLLLEQYFDANLPFFYHINEPWYSSHWHDELELMYFTENVTNVYLNNQKIQARPGDVVIANSNVIHSMSPADAKSSYYCFLFKKKFMEDHRLTNVFFRPFLTDPALQKYFDKLLADLEKKEEQYRIYTHAGLYAILTLLCRNYAEKNGSYMATGAGKSYMVKQAIEYINIHFAEPISLESVAKQIGFSKYYFCHEFKNVTGHTVSSYINFLRCRYAKELLSTTDYSVGKIAKQCGYNEQAYFSKVYKQCIGVSPSAEKRTT